MSKQKKKLNFQTVNTNNLFNEYLNKNIESINNNRNFIKPVNPMKKGAVENDAQDFLTKMVNSPLFADRYNVMRGYKASDAEVNSYRNHMINNMNKVQYWPTGVTYENKPWTEEDDYVGNYNKLYSLPKDEYNVDIMPDNPQWDYEDKRYRRQHMIFREHDSPMVTLHELSHASTNADGIPNQTYHPYSTDPLKKEDVEYYNSPDYRRSTEHKAYLDELRKYLYDNKIYDATNKVFDESDYENLIKENEKLNEKMKKDSNNIELKYIKDAFDKNILPFDKEQTIRLFNSFVNKDYNSDIQNAAMGGMIKRKDGSYSQRGLWDNIRANKGSGKEPTKEMLKQEKKIKRNNLPKLLLGGLPTGAASGLSGASGAGGGMGSLSNMNNMPLSTANGPLAGMMKMLNGPLSPLMGMTMNAVTNMTDAIVNPERERRPVLQNAASYTFDNGGTVGNYMDAFDAMVTGGVVGGGPKKKYIKVKGKRLATDSPEYKEYYNQIMADRAQGIYYNAEAPEVTIGAKKMTKKEKKKAQEERYKMLEAGFQAGTFDGLDNQGNYIPFEGGKPGIDGALNMAVLDFMNMGREDYVDGPLENVAEYIPLLGSALSTDDYTLAKRDLQGENKEGTFNNAIDMAGILPIGKYGNVFKIPKYIEMAADAAGLYGTAKDLYQDNISPMLLPNETARIPKGYDMNQKLFDYQKNQSEIPQTPVALKQKRMGGMIDPSMYMQQMMYGSYAQGGQVPQNIPVEVEGQEMYEMPNGQMGEFQGPSHENGGIPVALPEGTKVYSDRLKVNGKTMAVRKDKREANIAKLEKLLTKNPNDKFVKEALKRQQETASLEEQSDMAMQEQANQQQAQQEQAMMQEQMMGQLMQDPAMMQQMGMMMYGGKLANGTPPYGVYGIPNPLPMINNMVKQYNENINPPYKNTIPAGEGDVFTNFGSYPDYYYKKTGDQDNPRYSYFNPKGKETTWTDIPTTHPAHSQLDNYPNGLKYLNTQFKTSMFPSNGVIEEGLFGQPFTSTNPEVGSLSNSAYDIMGNQPKLDDKKKFPQADLSIKAPEVTSISMSRLQPAGLNSVMALNPSEKYLGTENGFSVIGGKDDEMLVKGTKPEPPGVNPYDAMNNIMGNTFGNISRSKDPYINTKGGLIPNPFYNEVISDKLMPNEDPKKPNRFMNFLNNAVDQTGDFFSGIFDKSGKPKKEKGTNPNSNYDLTEGDRVGMAGTSVGMYGPAAMTMLNKMATPKNTNFFSTFGQDALRTQEEAEGLAGISKDEAYRKNLMRANALRKQLANSARGVNDIRSGQLSAALTEQEGARGILGNYLQGMAGLKGQRAQLQQQIDQTRMGGEYQRDLADRQDIDQYYTNLAENVANASNMMQKQGKDLNVAQYNKDVMALSKAYSKYGVYAVRDPRTGLLNLAQKDANGNVVYLTEDEVKELPKATQTTTVKEDK
jgi:hypothetical protein